MGGRRGILPAGLTGAGGRKFARVFPGGRKTTFVALLRVPAPGAGGVGVAGVSNVSAVPSS